MTSLLKAILITWFLLGASAASADPTDLLLPNGLRVTLTHVPGADRVGIWLNIGVGAADEETNAKGIAHLAEHLFVRGPSSLPTFAARAAALGGEGVNAGTDFDATNFYWTVPREGLKSALRLEAERLRDPGSAVSSIVLEKERRIVLAEMRESDWTLDTRVKRAAFPMLYGERHPHAVLPDGRLGDLLRLSATGVRTFLRRWYRPANARLIVAGDIDIEATATEIAEVFGDIPRAADEHAAPATFPLTMAMRPTARVMLEADTAAITFYGVAPGRGHADSVPLEKAVAAMRSALAEAARRQFGPSVTSTLAYRPSARTGNVVVRLAFAGRSSPSGAEEFLKRWLRAAEVADIATPIRPRSPLHPPPGTVLAAAYGLLVDDEAVNAAFAKTNNDEANAAFRRWFMAPMLTVSTTARLDPVGPFEPPVEVEGWTISTFPVPDPTLARIELRRSAIGHVKSKSPETLRGALLSLFREDLGWTYQVQQSVSDADPAEVVLTFFVPRHHREDAVHLTLNILR